MRKLVGTITTYNIKDQAFANELEVLEGNTFVQPEEGNTTGSL